MCDYTSLYADHAMDKQISSAIMASAIGPAVSISMPSNLTGVRQLCLLAELWYGVQQAVSEKYLST